MRARQLAEGEWTTERELLAQAVELVSILASDHRIKEPREVPRPDWVRDRSTTTSPPANAYASAIDHLQATTR
ncbi:hypothetical protein GCM10022221_68700 [Actinocorallia aurea]